MHSRFLLATILACCLSGLGVSADEPAPKKDAASEPAKGLLPKL